MRIAFIIFDQITLLDFIGVYDPISRLKTMNYLPDLEWDVCSFTESAGDSFGLTIIPHKIQPSLSDYDAIIIPGGIGTRQIQHDEGFIHWIRSAQDVKYKISVCTGSLILGAAGFLSDKKATTHFNEYTTLKLYCKEVSTDRIIDDDDAITAGAVSASIDLGLYLCEKWAGKAANEAIRGAMNYRG